MKLKKAFICYHIDRIESHYGNVMVRGWAVSRRPGAELLVSVTDGKGRTLPVYVERLVRPDVNEMFGQEANCKSGLHILIDRAVLDTPYVWLVFDNGQERTRHKLRINDGAGLRSFVKVRQVQRHGLPDGAESDYDVWIRAQQPDRAQRKEQRARCFAENLKFSVVVPLYNTPREFLRGIIESVLNQTYENVELCLADGSSDGAVEQYIHSRYAKESRIRYCRLKKNRGISDNTNAAIRMARGDFLVFADHDDVLTADAVYELAAAVQAHPEADVIYSDEDKMNRSGKAYFGPHFKPDFSMELLCCNNYICHLFAVRRSVQEQVGLLDRAYDGAQDYDFVLRCCEAARSVYHIPRVLYHWRTHPQSTAGNPASKAYAFEAGRRAVEAHYRRAGIRARVESTAMLGRYRTWFAVEGTPLVSIVIPNKDHVEDLRRCVCSIVQRSTYGNYEIVIVENNSAEAATEEFYSAVERGGEEFSRGISEGDSEANQAVGSRGAEQTEASSQRISVRVLHYPSKFNYAAIHNWAIPQVRGEYAILLNNDTEVISPGWIEELLGICQKPDVGAVGAKLYYPDGTIQHAGVVLGLCGVASHIFVGYPGDKDGYAGRLVSVQDMSAVTAACMMTKRSSYLAVGGMEEALAVSYNDIDYCLRLRRAGQRVVFTPYAELTHYESKTRGLEDTPEKKERLAREAALFEERWREELAAGDPFYNPNLSRTKADCSLGG